MKQSDLIDTIADNASIAKSHVSAVFTNFGIVAQAALAAGEDVPLPGLGTLKPVARAAREGRNPLTGDKLKIPAKTAVKFTAAKALKDAVNPVKKGKKK